jgi:hypothetical protein
MATDLSLEKMKQRVRDHFDDFVNKRKDAVIHKNTTPDIIAEGDEVVCRNAAAGTPWEAVQAHA